ncbi:hypothetical protein Tco_1320749 [Tanacetum coccineum]
MLNESSSRSSSESEEKTHHNLRRILASEERTRIKMMELGIIEDLSFYDNESWNQRDFAKLLKAISLPQDVMSTSDCHLIELENQVQRLMEAHLAPKPSVQVNKIASSCEICGGPHDTQYCIKNPEQDFVNYESLCTDEARGLESNFMASQDARLSMFEADFKQQQSDMTNKIETFLKADVR